MSLSFLCCFRSLISRLEQVDAGRLKHEEKLAFWINIHNALVMHVIILSTIWFCVMFSHLVSGVIICYFVSNRHFWLMGFHKTM